MSDQNKQLNTLESTYLYKKTEKLVSAFYLLSNFISDKEPIKWQLREVGMSLLTQSFYLSNGQTFTADIMKSLSILQVANLAGLVSEMNLNILKFELENLIKFVGSNGEKRDSDPVLFPTNFFQVSESSADLLPGVSPVANPPAIDSKGHNIMSDRLSVKPVPPREKSNRQDIIITLLKKNKELSIKDFTSGIKGCSEKTIQRELASLVSKGQVKKMGEKRWSRYSLK